MSIDNYNQSHAEGSTGGMFHLVAPESQSLLLANQYSPIVHAHAIEDISHVTLSEVHTSWLESLQAAMQKAELLENADVFKLSEFHSNWLDALELEMAKADARDSLEPLTLSDSHTDWLEALEVEMAKADARDNLNDFTLSRQHTDWLEQLEIDMAGADIRSERIPEVEALTLSEIHTDWLANKATLADDSALQQAADDLASSLSDTHGEIPVEFELGGEEAHIVNPAQVESLSNMMYQEFMPLALGSESDKPLVSSEPVATDTDVAEVSYEVSVTPMSAFDDLLPEHH